MAPCPSCRSEVPPGSRFCGVCGTALAAAVPYAPYGVLPPKKNNTVLIIVLVVVFLVIVPAVVSAIFYIMVSGLIRPPQNPRPVMTLVVSTETSTQAGILVGGMQPSTSPGNLKANLGVNGSFGVATSLPAISDAPVDISIGGYPSPFTIRWEDVGGDGMVSSGDQFLITYPSVLPAGTMLDLYVLWYDGSVIATIAWST